MRTVSCEKRYKNWYNWELWKGIPPTELHPFIILKKRFGVSPRKCAPACVEKGWDKLRCVIFLEF